MAAKISELSATAIHSGALLAAETIRKLRQTTSSDIPWKRNPTKSSNSIPHGICPVKPSKRIPPSAQAMPSAAIHIAKPQPSPCK